VNQARTEAGAGRVWLLIAASAALIAGLFAAGWLPRLQRDRELAEAAGQRKAEIPEVAAARARRSPGASDLALPGNVTPVTETMIGARAAGYLKRRLVDIGDRVRTGQLLAEIEAPELGQQVVQAEAGVSQAKAALAAAQFSLRQAQANLKLAQVTLDRWNVLVAKGVVSRHEADQKQADFEAKQATVEAASAGIRAASDNVHASEANRQRLVEMLAYTKIYAPFSGIITARLVDVGSLIAASGAPLYRIAQTGVLRIMVDVPQSNARFIRVGQEAEVTLQEFPGRKFPGRVTRTADALDAGTRTLPVEVQVQNSDGALLPNMYANVRLVKMAATPTVLIPGDTLLMRPNGLQVAVIGKENRIHMQPIEAGRDFGPFLEVRSGLEGDEMLVANATDDVREGARVRPVEMAEASAPGERKAARAAEGSRKVPGK
jgi:RND family efflux transporter MFP subunit